MNDCNYLPADLADFEAFIAQHRDPDLQRWIRAQGRGARRDWKHGDPHSLCDVEVDPHAPEDGDARVRYIRDLATRDLAHTYPRDIRREAAHDPALVWNPLARRYRLRALGDAPAGCASAGQPDRTGDRRDTAPTPGDRSPDLIAGAPDLNQRVDDASEGVGG